MQRRNRWLSKQLPEVYRRFAISAFAYRISRPTLLQPAAIEQLEALNNCGRWAWLPYQRGSDGTRAGRWRDAEDLHRVRAILSKRRV